MKTETSTPSGRRNGFLFVKYTLKALGLLLVFGTIGILIWRLATSGNPKSMKGLAVNRPVYEAWQASSEEDPLTIFAQKLDNITRAKHNRGYFSTADVKFVEEAQQVQLLFRYNNSTIRHLKEDYHLDHMPGRDEDLYDVSLVVAYDLTPDRTDDNDGNDPASVRFERFHPTSCTAEKKNLYNYRQFIFDGVDMTVTENPVLAVYADVYYKGDIDYTKDSYGTLIIYEYRADRVLYDLSKKDLEKLRAFGQ